MKPFPLSLLFAAALAATAQRAFSSDAGGPTTIEINPALVDGLVAEAQGRNPALQAAGARVEAANEAASGIRTWEDPTASFGVWAAGSGGFGASEQGNLVYGIEQKLPLHGRPGLMRTVAAADADRQRFASDYETLRLRRDLEIGLFALSLADREADLAREDLAWLDSNVSAVDNRYRVGQATQVDWLRAQTARAMAADDLTTKEQMRDHSAFSINRLLNRDLHAAWPRVAVPALQPQIYYTPKLVAAALDSEPQLRVMRQESVSAQASADLTRRAGLPDVSLGLQAWQYTGDGALKQAMATVSFSVPWLNRGRYDSDWRRDQAKKRASDHGGRGLRAIPEGGAAPPRRRPRRRPPTGRPIPGPADPVDRADPRQRPELLGARTRHVPGYPGLPSPPRERPTRTGASADAAGKPPR